MKSAALCNIGALRMVNQDSVFSSDDPVGSLPDLYVVADGMGGHAAGEKASSRAVASCVGYAAEHGLVVSENGGVTKDDVLSLLGEMLVSANQTVYGLAQANEAWKGMGTTMVVATILDNYICCANVGDSRLYIVNRQNQLERVTVDHSFVEMLVQKGEITEEEARVHPKRNFITRAVGTEEQVQPDYYTIPCSDVHMVMLCSDGLSSQIPEMRINEIINLRSYSLEERVQFLVNEANRNGGKDNITVILIDLEGGDSV